MKNQGSLADRVTSNPSLNAAEKETSINMYGDKKEAKVFSAKSTVVKSLLKNDHFDAEWVAGDNDGTYAKREPENAGDLSAIYEVSGVAPVGLLTVKSTPRSNDHQSGIVNWKGVDPDAFE